MPTRIEGARIRSSGGILQKELPKAARLCGVVLNSDHVTYLPFLSYPHPNAFSPLQCSHMPFRLWPSRKLYYLGNEQKIGRYIWHPTAIRVEGCSLAGGITDRPGVSLSVGI